MAYSEVEIVNIALNSLGRESIRSFSVSDDDPKTGRLSERLYQIARDALIAKHDWSFARKTKALQALDEDHIEGEVFGLPSDCFVPRRIGPRYGLPNVWRIEGRTIMIPSSHTQSCGTLPYLRYTRYVYDTTFYPPYFVDALAKDIEARLCMPITKDKKLTKELKLEARALFGQAALIDSNLDAGDDHHSMDAENDTFINPDPVGAVFYGE